MGLYQLNIDGNDFLEADVNIDSVNWYSAERWQQAADK